MSGHDLNALIRGYIESDGFRIVDQGSYLLVADRLVFGDERDTRLIWTIPAGQEVPHLEATLRGSINSNRVKYPDARGYVVAESRAGFSRNLLQLLNDQRVSLRVPIEFFDTNFKVEDRVGRAARSAIDDVLGGDLGDRRVAQPYELEQGGGHDGSDLLSALLHEMDKDHASVVRVVVGRAGIGKSSLFNALFSRSYRAFQASKSRRERGRRPIPLVVQHIRGAVALRTELLVENFLRADVAQPVSRDTFEWLLTNGFASWMMDGLDELYAGDPHFFDYLTDLITRRGEVENRNKAQLTIFCRDSLLTTSPEFANFRELLSTGERLLRVYRLREWDSAAKRHFAWLNLEGRLPKKEEVDSPRVSGFLSTLSTSVVLRNLSCVPFYCWVVLQNYNDGDIREYHDDVEMLDHFIDKMIEREVRKGLLDLRSFETNGLQDWLEEFAVRHFEDGFIDQNEALEYGKLVLRANLTQEAQEHMFTTLLQFPLFAEGRETGQIRFAHDLISEALAARRYAQLLERGGDDLGYRLSRVDMQSPNVLRFMASKVSAKSIDQLIQRLQFGVVPEAGFSRMLTLLLLIKPEATVIKDHRIGLEGRELSGVHFRQRDLSSVSLRNSDLTATLFDTCNMQGCLFEGAFFYRTSFLGVNDLRDAKFGDLGRIQSLLIEKKLIEDQRRIPDWIATATGHQPPQADPCPTAMQVRYLFAKFVTPLGDPRRDMVTEAALLAGKRYPGAAGADACVKAGRAHGYLDGPDFRGRWSRPAGDRLSELVKMVRDGSVSDGIGRMIGEICARRGCTHQPNPFT